MNVVPALFLYLGLGKGERPAQRRRDLARHADDRLEIRAVGGGFGLLRLARLLQKTHPNAAEGLRLRAGRYNQGVALTQRLAKEGRAVILAPDDTCGVDTLTRDAEPLCRLYDKGRADFEKLARFLG